MLFEGLTKSAPDGSVEMALADTLEISPDGLRYLFHLRPSVWSDGKPVTAKDFEKSWKAALNPASGCLAAYLFYPILNAERAYKGQVSADEIGVRALSDNLLEVLLEHPADYFLSLTAFPSYLPTPSHALAQFDNWLEREDAVFVSNGPFLLQLQRKQSQLLLSKNERYWNPTQTYLDEIQIAIVGNETTALQMFEKGELDWIGGAISPLPPDSLQTIQKRFTLHSSPMAATTFCTFHLGHPLLSNRHLRLALALAINRSDIVQNITQMGELPATRFIPPSLASNRNRLLYQPFDPGLARLHLEKALEELQLSAKDLSLTLSFRTSQLDTRIAQTLQTQWKETLGLEIALDAKETHSFKEKLLRREFEIALAFWIAQFSDPLNILERFEDPNNWKNYPGWINHSFCEKVRAVRLQSDPLLHHDAIEEAEEILASDMPLAPIYHWSNPSLSNPRLKNVQTTPNGGVLFERSYFQ